jgi:hypothetical protein
MSAVVYLAGPSEFTVVDGVLQDLMHDAFGDSSLGLPVTALPRALY